MLRDLADLPDDIREPLQHLNAQIPLLLARGNGAEIRATLDSLEEFEEPADPLATSEQPAATHHDLETKPIETVMRLFAPPHEESRTPYRPLAMRVAQPAAFPGLASSQQR